MEERRLLSELDMSFFARTIQRILRVPVETALLSPDKEYLWSSGDVGSDRQKYACSDLTELDVPGMRPGVQVTDRISGERDRFAEGLFDEHERLIAIVLVTISGVDPQGLDDHRQVVSDLIGELRRQFLLIKEVNAMAVELSQRYEEINLAYGRRAHSASESGVNEQLKFMLEDLRTRMDLDAVILGVPEQGLLISGCSESADMFLSPESCQRIFDIGSRLVADEGHGVVLNQTSCSRLSIDADDKTLNLAAIPVSVSEYSDAALVCLRVWNRSEFSASDRKLFEYVSDQVSHIVRSDRDPLTGLPSRDTFKATIEGVLAGQSGLSQAVVLQVNIDQFKIFNEVYGMVCGDTILRECARIIRRTTGKEVLVARLGGNDFGVYLPGIRMHDGKVVAESLRSAIERQIIDFAEHRIRVTVSIAVVMISNAIMNDPAKIFNALEVTLAASKEYGVNRVEAYLGEGADVLLRHGQMHWVERIKEALEYDRFELYCQRIEPLGSGSLHYEILLRMRDENEGLVLPGLFLDAAERYGLMATIDRWVIERALSMLDNAPAYVRDQHISWGINLSGIALGSVQHRNFIKQKLGACSIPTERVYFEITESTAIKNYPEVVEFVRYSKELGCRFALDDFGKGYSSFTYLKNLPVDYLKIDGSFVTNIEKSDVDRAMVEAICRIARVMGLQTIAEFVENDTVIDHLRTIGVDYVQGNFVGHPEPLARVLERLDTTGRAGQGPYEPSGGGRYAAER